LPVNSPALKDYRLYVDALIIEKMVKYHIDNLDNFKYIELES